MACSRPSTFAAMRNVNLCRRMSYLILKSSLCVLALVVVAGCGSPGVPLPPSLELARPVTDLRAVRKGDRVYLSWSVPSLTTDGRNIRHPGPTEICRSIETAMSDCGTALAKVSPPNLPQINNFANKVGASFTDQLSEQFQFDHATAGITYAVSVLNPYGRSAGLSNKVQIPAAPTLPAPAEFEAQLTAEGVHLQWKGTSQLPQIAGLRFVYRVYRREQQSNKDSVVTEISVGDQSSTSVDDQAFEWEKTYDYRATVVTLVAQANGSEQQVEGDDTPSITIVAHDVFPAATPTGLQAVFSGSGQKLFIDLVWTPNTESDLAGYNVYRHEVGSETMKVNSELIRTPAFRDADVASGHQYFYSVSAVDLRGNESPHSEEANESAP
jgi:hypothetical protein